MQLFSTRLVFGGKNMQFHTIYSLQYCNISINAVNVDPDPDFLHDRLMKPKQLLTVALTAERVNSGREKSGKNRSGSGSRASKPRSALADEVDEPFTMSGHKNIGKCCILL